MHFTYKLVLSAINTIRNTLELRSVQYTHSGLIWGLALGRMLHLWVFAILLLSAATTKWTIHVSVTALPHAASKARAKR